jgi:hypothetical protein
VYKALKPACTHAYVLRNATVAELLLKEMGHDVVKPVDLTLISLIEVKGDQIPMYVMLPPPITQLWRTKKRKVRSTTFPEKPNVNTDDSSPENLMLAIFVTILHLLPLFAPTKNAQS